MVLAEVWKIRLERFRFFVRIWSGGGGSICCGGHRHWDRTAEFVLRLKNRISGRLGGNGADHEGLAGKESIGFRKNHAGGLCCVQNTFIPPQIVIFNLYTAGEPIPWTVRYLRHGGSHRLWRISFFRSQTIQHRLYFIYGRITE